MEARPPYPQTLMADRLQRAITGYSSCCIGTHFEGALLFSTNNKSPALSTVVGPFNTCVSPHLQSVGGPLPWAVQHGLLLCVSRYQKRGSPLHPVRPNELQPNKGSICNPDTNPYLVEKQPYWTTLQLYAMAVTNN